MRRLKKNCHELRDHVEFFKSWFGELWEIKLRLRAGLYRNQCAQTLNGFDEFTFDLLPKLRRVRYAIEHRSCCDVRRAQGSSEGRRAQVLHVPAAQTHGEVLSREGARPSVSLSLLQCVPSEEADPLSQESASPGDNRGSDTSVRSS
jgi:hypothetical protein